MSDEDPVAREIAEQAAALLTVMRTPELAAEKLVDWLRAHYPQRVQSAYWVTMDHARDKGVAVDVYRLPAKLRLRALFGGWSAGAAVFSPDLYVGRTRVSVGAGAVAPYLRLGEWRPVVSLAVRL